MASDDLTELLTALWTYGAAPLAGLAALLLTVRLKLPQLMQLPAALRAMREEDPEAPGSAHPAAAVAMSAVTSYGVAAAIGAATAVSLGGPGAIAWVWIFSFLLAPLRMGEAVLTRTAPAGRAGEPTASLAGRLLAGGPGLGKVLGWAMLGLVPLAGFAFFGGTHGGAVLDASEQLLPGSSSTLGLLVAAAGAALAMLPRRRAGSILGWMAAVALFALLAAALVAFSSNMGRGVGAFARAVQDISYGMPRVGAFSGALAGEIAMAAVLYLLPPLAAAGGVAGTWHPEAKATTTRAQAAAALLGTLIYAAMTTVLGFSFVATNAFSRPVEDTRAVGEITFYSSTMETVSQRTEESRRLQGPLRITEGGTGVVSIHPATERGMIRGPSFEQGGEPADALLRVIDGDVVEIQQPGDMGALQVAPLSAYDEITIRGEMLPRGGRLLARSMGDGGGPIMQRVAIAALLLLAALAAAGWGFGVRQTLAAVMPDSQARFTALIPSLGLGLAATGVVQDFSSWGLVAGALLTMASSAALILSSGEIAALLASRPAPRPTPPAAPEGAARREPKKPKKRRRS